MLRLVEDLDLRKYSDFVYISASDDVYSAQKFRERSKDAKVTVTLESIHRSRHVGQSWTSSLFTTFISILWCFPLVWKHKADLLLVNGPGTCVPLVWITGILNMLRLRSCRIVFIESICRVETLSLSAKLSLPFLDALLVQWPELYASYPHTSTYIGRLV
ncbi:unnamed protein product [Cyprideis torosa]|uniref:UDP-N-acetylglucosamine transferase subunit ALG14 n=1 Tax=Cyprideis torosa TaxID=163714 RepID=A0A7R8ZK89_9CRUS|nr:unnamed protein product [Cyprideis torosa]CAG0881248.1 unnamed protein product [Cyprideis torosa]